MYVPVSPVPIAHPQPAVVYVVFFFYILFLFHTLRCAHAHVHVCIVVSTPNSSCYIITQQFSNIFCRHYEAARVLCMFAPIEMYTNIVFAVYPTVFFLSSSLTSFSSSSITLRLRIDSDCNIIERCECYTYNVTKANTRRWQMSNSTAQRHLPTFSTIGPSWPTRTSYVHRTHISIKFRIRNTQNCPFSSRSLRFGQPKWEEYEKEFVQLRSGIALTNRIWTHSTPALHTLVWHTYTTEYMNIKTQNRK